MAHQSTTAPISSNQPAVRQPFQRWFKFKEAFSPQLILDCLQVIDGDVRDCLDPFGGSGTCALTCQFLGIHPTTIEVNPFLGDLIEAKLSAYDLALLRRDFSKVLRVANQIEVDSTSLLSEAPQTMIEPGIKGRWIFSRRVADRIVSLSQAIDTLSQTENRRLLKVVLASILLDVSNVIVNGKGRRYRRNWRERAIGIVNIDEAFQLRFEEVLLDLQEFSKRECRDYRLIRGDSRTRLAEVQPVDVAIFSPPYPNSFDYTDIYNLELWMLGYLTSKSDNTELRNLTLRSHVQIRRQYEPTECQSDKLERTYQRLVRARSELWNRNIPEMVVSYFEDMLGILIELRRKVRTSGHIFMAVGSSKYAGVIVDTAAIISELAPAAGLAVIQSSAIRSMRSSSQQGGFRQLREAIICLQPA